MKIIVNILNMFTFILKHTTLKFIFKTKNN